MTHSLCFKRTLLASAISLAFAGNGALADEVQELIDPGVSEVGVTLWHLNEVNPLYRTYTGLNDQGAHGALDLGFVRRTDSGRWLMLQGRGLGLNNQELQASVEQQGDWGVRLGYNEITRYAPFKVLTGASGIGSESLTLAGPPPASGPEHDLKTKRSATSIGMNKFLSENLQVNFSFKHEDKEGARLSGINGTGYMRGITQTPSPLPLNLDGIPLQVFAPEPIDSTHQQFEAAAHYTTRTFQVSAGYYGSFFSNNTSQQLNVQNSAGTQLFYSPALAPDNQSQEFYLSGAYRFNEGTRGTFSVSKAIGKQDDEFITVTRSTAELNPAAAGQPAVLTQRRNLDGEVETTNIAATLSSRVSQNLTLNGSVSHDEHDDKTPKEVYVIDWGHNKDPLTNNPETTKTTRGKVEGVYRLPADYRLTVGYDYDQKHFEGMDEEGYRKKVKEDTVRVDLSKSLNDYLNGSLTLSHGDRQGSSWGSTPTLVNDGAHPTGLHWVAPTQFSDRERDRLRLLLEWLPVRALSVQFAYEYAEEDFETRHLEMGLNDRKSALYSLDASYRLDDSWKASAWYSYGDGTQRQRAIQSSFGSLCNGTTYASMIGATAASTCVPWSLDLQSRSESVGAGLLGQMNSRLDVGGRLVYSRDVVRYDLAVVDQGPTTPVLSGAGVLPNTEYTLTTLHLFAKYAVTKATAMRVDFVWDRREMDDYTWANWSYSDGTRVYVDPKQITSLVGLTVSHAF